MSEEKQWACARNNCLCRYYPSQTTVEVEPYPACPNCGNEQDVFPVDDKAWPVDKYTKKVEIKFWDWKGIRKSTAKVRQR